MLLMNVTHSSRHILPRMSGTLPTRPGTYYLRLPSLLPAGLSTQQLRTPRGPGYRAMAVQRVQSRY
jgi:hypothetical protein